MGFLKYITGLAIFIAPVVLSAQVSGRVVEITGADTVGVPGAMVLWEKTTTGTSTDDEGRFSLPADSTANTLLLKAIGYEDKSVKVTDASKAMLLVIKRGVELTEVEVVYYSTGTEISYLNPMKVEVLNERSLMKAACCNLSESFETNPSIDVNFADVVSGAKQIQMLGLAGQYAQITKENMPYMRGLAGAYGLTFIPGTWIQSIQLSKGAGSVVNGYESFTGQINTELQNPAASDRLHFNTYVNQNRRNEYNLNLRTPVNKKFDVGLLSHLSFNPLKEDMNHDGFADIPGGRQQNFMNKYSFQDPKSGFEAQFGGGYMNDERYGGQVMKMASDQHHADTLPLYDITLLNRKWELYSKTGYVFKKHPGHSTGLQLSYLDHEQRSTYGLRQYEGLQRTFYANYIYQGILGNTNHGYKLGTSFMHDRVNERFELRGYNREENVAGVFTEYAYNFKEKFNMVAGLRGDLHNYYGFFATPRLHLRYAPKENTVFRISGGRALRTANIFADNAPFMATSRQWVIAAADSSMPYGLKPETGWNYGFNFTQRFKINYREAYVTLDLYRSDFESQVVVDADASTQALHIYNLRGPSYSNTAQFEFNMEPRKRFFTKFAYRYVDTRVQYRQGLMQRPFVSMHRGFVNFSYETRDKHWQIDATTQYHGGKRLPSTAGNPGEFRRGNYAPDYFIQMGQITYLRKIKTADLHVYVGVENAFNYKQPHPIVSVDQPFGAFFDAAMVWGPIYGRMMYAGLRLKIK
jgi:outer membrane receptor for ferrienterochelin and colicins